MKVDKPEARLIETPEGIDDLYAPGVDVHIEHMGDGIYFIGIMQPGGGRLVLQGKSIRMQWIEEATIPNASRDYWCPICNRGAEACLHPIAAR